jgi:predicted MPP superfamily phosphohydrolase
MMRRRHFLAAAGAAAGAALTADAFAIETRRVQLTRHDVRVPRLPPALHGLRIAQVADLHLPACHGPAEAALQLLERERPEIVLHTGDAVEIAEAAQMLVNYGSVLRGTVATAAVLGNWEHRVHLTGRGAEQAWGRVDVPLLVNAHLTVRVGDATLALVGLDDMLYAHPDFEAARRGLPDGITEIWLGHEPVVADLAPAGVPRPALFLSGHTHGGQIRLPGVPAFTPPGSGRYVAGWYLDSPAPLYVSRGIGTADIRARFRCPPELPVFRLLAA